MAETKRKIQRRTAQQFIEWLNEGRVDSDFLKVQEDVTKFIIGAIETREACDAFIGRWASVLNQCNEPSTYNYPMGALAYCHVHFLERYRRFYRVLIEIYKIGHLPITSGGTRILDVGAGPAPCLFAAQDFFRQVRDFFAAHEPSTLSIAEPTTVCVEQSHVIGNMLHHFSEMSGRRGPYGARFDDFFSLDLQKLRTLSVKAAARSELEAMSDDPDAPFPFSPQDFKYDLYIFSNFLTEVDTVERAKEHLKKLFYWLSLGQSLVVLGGTNPPYPDIYARIKIIAAQTRVNQIDELLSSLPCSYDDVGAQLIKKHYSSVINHMRCIHPNLSIPGELTNAQDLWDPDVRLKGPKQFSVRLFTRRRLLPGQRWRRKKSINRSR